MSKKATIDDVMALPEVERISRVSPTGNDVILIEAKRHINHDEASHIKLMLEEVFPDNKVMVVGPDYTVKIVDGDAARH
jgi:hypothetical protein